MTVIYVPEIACESCVKRIRRALTTHHITMNGFTDSTVTVSDKTEEAVNVIRDLGYRAATTPFERKTFRERVRHFNEHKEHYAIERRGLRNGLLVLATLTLLMALAYGALFRFIPEFITTYGWWIAYLIISITSISIAVWHFTAYRATVTCMTGMMIGMTFGMQTGMMLGAIIGATNGFFWGAMTGMILGTAVGILTGKCCGIMGVMEGAMAGVMGGTMGPMISVMLFTDNLLWFMPFFMAINVFIILGLSYLLYEEVIEGKPVETTPVDTATLVSLSIIATAALAALMVYGPSSSLLTIG